MDVLVQLWTVRSHLVHQCFHNVGVKPSPEYRLATEEEVGLSTKACHDYESSECASARQHKVADVACYRPPRGHWWGAPAPLLRGSVHLISVLELTNNEVVGGGCHWPWKMPPISTAM